jgi:hypothetical protein
VRRALGEGARASRSTPLQKPVSLLAIHIQTSRGKSAAPRAAAAFMAFRGSGPGARRSTFQATSGTAT